MALRKSPRRSPELTETARANSRRSTGPRSPNGKQVAKMNATDSDILNEIAATPAKGDERSRNVLENTSSTGTLACGRPLDNSMLRTGKIASATVAVAQQKTHERSRNVLENTGGVQGERATHSRACAVGQMTRAATRASRGVSAYPSALMGQRPPLPRPLSTVMCSETRILFSL